MEIGWVIPCVVLTVFVRENVRTGRPRQLYALLAQVIAHQSIRGIVS